MIPTIKFFFETPSGHNLSIEKLFFVFVSHFLGHFEGISIKNT